MHAGQDSKSGGTSLSVARGLPALPRVRCSIHAGPVLGHSLDHVQEEGPLALLLAPVLEPLLNLLEGSGEEAGWSQRGWGSGRGLRTPTQTGVGRGSG